VPVYTVEEYVARFNAIEAWLQGNLDSSKAICDACVEGCETTFAPPATALELQKCMAKCEKDQRDRDFAARAGAVELHTELDDEARFAGILEPVMIIIDRELTYLLAEIKKDSPWGQAAVLPVESLTELKKALTRNRVAQSLLLVTYGEKAQISIGNELVSLPDLARLSPLMRVNAYFELRGLSDGVSPPGNQADRLAEALGTEEWSVRWEYSGAQVRISVDQSDKATYPIPSVLSAAESPYDHFVTVVGKKDKPVKLRAIVEPLTDANRKALTWSATGGRITPNKANRLIATISRTDPKKVVVRARVKGKVARTIIVWVVWCQLEAGLTDGSGLDGQELGLQGRRRETRGQYWAEARIDWMATIEPASIITDRDRPAIRGGFPVTTLPGATVEAPGWEVPGNTREWIERRAGASGPLNRTINRGWSPVAKISERVINPYLGQPPLFGANVRWIEVFTDGHGTDGSIERKRRHGRAFVQVELDGNWVQCSTYYYWRWHYFVKREGGKWIPEPGKKEILDLTAPSNF
jgi:hypothetical protein